MSSVTEPTALSSPTEDAPRTVSERVAAYVAERVAEAPPLTADQHTALREVLWADR